MERETPDWNLMTKLYLLELTYKGTLALTEYPIARITDHMVFLTNGRRIDKDYVDTKPNVLSRSYGVYFSSVEVACRVWWTHWRDKMTYAQDMMERIRLKASENLVELDV